MSIGFLSLLLAGLWIESGCQGKPSSSDDPDSSTADDDSKAAEASDQPNPNPGMSSSPDSSGPLSSSGPATSGPEDTQSGAGGCAGLDEPACAAMPGCTMTSGRRLRFEGLCFEAMEQAGCSSGDCGDGTITFSKDESGVLWRFSTGCFPDSWTPIESTSLPKGADSWPGCDEPGESKTACGDLDEASCGAKTECTWISGTPLDFGNMCKEQTVSAGCSSGDCGDEATAFAQDTTGKVWYFSSQCWPDGWTELGGTGVLKDADAWPGCG